MTPTIGSNGLFSGVASALIRVYAPANAQLNGDLLELSGAFNFLEFYGQQAIFSLTAAVAGNVGRTIQLGGIVPIITPPSLASPSEGIPYGMVKFPNACLCWTSRGDNVYTGLFVRTLPFPALGLTA